MVVDGYADDFWPLLSSQLVLSRVTKAEFLQLLMLILEIGQLNALSEGDLDYVVDALTAQPGL